MTTRIALVGALGYGAYYRKQIFEHQELADHDATLVAAIDPRHGALEPDCDLKRHGVPCYASLDDFLAVDHADLVIIATPIHTHLPLCRQALASGAHVLLEKPLCATPAEARELCALAAGEQLVSIGYQWSHSEPMLRLKREIAAGAFGAPIDMQVHCLWPRPASYYERAAWAGRLTLDNGAAVYDSPMNNACAHYLFNMLWLWGDQPGSAAAPTTIRASLSRCKPIESCDTCLLDIQTTAGIPLRFAATHAVANQAGPVISYRFAEATMSCAPHYGSDLVVTHADGRSESYGAPDGAGKIASCLDVIAGRAPNPCTVEAAAMHSAVIAAAHSSPIVQAPAELVVDPGDGGSIAIDGLEATIETAMAQQQLPDLPWAPLSEPIDCRPYLVS